ncbi:hypothetical protein [Baekduia sp. Peel2402]|uniref:hypothetical protein n=1 Tax=Baekduia sp. Peel2402 TaxID=3458296 RepID=UPI00403E9296
MKHHDDDTHLDRYLDAFGARLEAAAAPVTTATKRRFPRIALLATTATATALAITLVALLLPGGSTTHRLDVVAEARAALAPHPDELTHLVVRQRITGDASLAGIQTEFASEQWSATKPVRWRTTYNMPSNSTIHPGRRIEVAYARGVEQEYYPGINHVRRSRGIKDHPAPAAYPLGTDPIATMRAMLAAGTLHDSGTAKVGDREVRRLVGTRTRSFSGAKERKPTKVVNDVQYYVDPDTFAPIRARIGMPYPKGAAPLYVVLDFDAFERIPLNAESEKLLEVQPKPGVSITELGAKRR